jgi:hypothetical protein
MKSCTIEKARSAKARVAEMLRDEHGLTGVGITREGDSYAVKVNLDAAPGTGLEIPSEMDGVPIRVEITGRIKARRPKP